MMRIPIIKMDVDVTSNPKAVGTISDWVVEQSGRYVCVSNVHMCMEVFDDEGFSSVVNKSDLTVADGKPISLAQRLLGNPDAEQIRGEDLTLALCREAEVKRFSVGFFGATDELLVQLKQVLLLRFPGLNIAYSCAPPFNAISDAEDRQHTDEINASGVRILFVGLGCPKQERWMAEHRNGLSCVMLGVGAAFDFIAGNKKNAPQWMQTVGLEWLFRLLSEPRRLWKRYLKHNPRFVWYFGLQLLKSKVMGRRS